MTSKILCCCACVCLLALIGCDSSKIENKENAEPSEQEIVIDKETRNINFGEEVDVSNENGNYKVKIDKVVEVEDSDIFSTEWDSLKEDNKCIAVLISVDNYACKDWEPAEMTLYQKIF